MSRPTAPSMPTERQVNEAHRAVTALYPKARIKCLGPDGVHFDYPDQIDTESEWSGRPFSADKP
jgi:hypothetical protein